MEFVNQVLAYMAPLIDYLTPYLGEYASYAPIGIGVILALVAFVIKRRVMKSMDADIRAAEQKASESAPLKKEEPQSARHDTETDATTSVVVDASKKEATPKADDAGQVIAESTEKQPSDLVKTENQPVLEKKVVPVEPVPEQPKLSWAQRMKSGLSRTRNGFGSGLASLIGGSKHIDEDLLEEIETQLLTADVGIDATQSLISVLTEKLNRKELKNADALFQSLRSELNQMIVPSEQALQITDKAKPFVILMVGVNGVGKTTTIGKLAKKFQAEGKSVMLAAGDTFRAAAVEQLQVWGERNQVPVIAQHTGADSASVIYDAIESAKAKGVDVVIADTAGRLQNKANLMSELEKVVRVMKKLDVEAPHEVMLVLDAGTGQNALSQAKLFTEAVGVSGITITKLDGTAKGGILFAIAKQFGLPIRFIGVGEQVDDLRPFVAQEFVEALFDTD